MYFSVSSLKNINTRTVQLVGFAKGARRLRESPPMITCTRKLETSISVFLHLIRKNASQLCPAFITSSSGTPSNQLRRMSQTIEEPSFNDEQPKIAPIADEMLKLADDVNALLKSLELLSQFEDQKIHDVFRAFAADLMVSAL